MIARTQPLLVAWLSTIIITLAAKYVPGLKLSDEQALYLAGGLFTVGTWLAHRKVTPVARPRNNQGEALVPTSQVMTAVVQGDVPDTASTMSTPPPKPPTSRVGQVYDQTKQPPTR